MKILVCLFGTVILFVHCSFGQMDSTAKLLTQFPNRIFAKINNKTASLDDALTKQTEKYLQRLAKEEIKFKKQLYKLDSTSAARFYANDPQKGYNTFIQKMQTDSAVSHPSMGPQYLPYVDSLQGSLAFLNKNPQLLNNSKYLSADAENTLNQIKLLQTKMEDADQVKQFIQSRKVQLQQLLTQYTHLPPSLTNIYNDYNEEVYYYSEQIKEYREMLNDPDEMERTALQLLDKLPAFTNFMQKNSFLAGVFNIPGDYGTAAGMEGLQSRDQVLALIQNQIGSGGGGASAALQQNLQVAQADINKLHDKLSSLGSGNGDIDMPNFKPNDQKTKTLLKRLDLGINIQTTRANGYFPSTTDLGLSIGYKISDKSTIGIGGSYNVGWGTSINNIHFTSQGISLRSFIDVQIKKNIYISGGFEESYVTPFTSLAQLKTTSMWQRSGLIGLSKMVSLPGKIVKKTKVSLLWNFLSYYQLPSTQPLIFRVGYNF